MTGPPEHLGAGGPTSPALEAPSPTPEALRPQLLREQVRLLYERAPVAQVVVVVVAVVTVAVLGGSPPRPPAMAWLAAVVALGAVRWVLIRRSRARPISPAHAPAWALAYLCGTAASGVVWGLSAVLFFAPADPVREMFLALVLAGLSAGAAMTNASYGPAAVAFMVPAVLPLAVRFLLAGGPAHLATGFLLVVFAVGLALLASTGNRALEDGVRLRLQNQALADHLARRTAEQRQAETAGRRHLRALRTLGACNEALVRATDETELLGQICGLLVEVGGYRLCWVGLAEHDARRTVRPVAEAGFEEGYLATVDVVWADEPRGRGPLGLAIRSGAPVLIADVASDPRFAPWREEAARRGYGSVLALPLRAEGAVLGGLALYAGSPDAFDGDEVRLLTEAADDLAFGMVALRGRRERARMTAQLMHADRLVSIGTVAAGVAHEVNNPLAYVVASVDFLEQAVAAAGTPQAVPCAELAGTLRDMRAGLERIRRTVRDLKAFSRADEESRGAIDVHRVLESTLNIAMSEIRHRARLVKEYGPVPTVDANEARLGQIFLNLLVNAAQAIPEGAVSAHEIRVVTSTAPDGRALVEVRDDGCGIPAEHLARIFDPFFTTKPPGVGTGLGLSICRDVVAGLGGEIAVESTPGKGSAFRVLLPPGSAVGAQPAPPPPAPTPRRARVLAVDDEPLVARAVQRALGREHDVHCEESAEAALARIHAGEHFDVVLCDLMMPRMNGMEFFEALAARRPELAARVVFISGGASTSSAQAFLARVENPLLDKPFDTQRLRAMVQALAPPRPN